MGKLTRLENKIKTTNLSVGSSMAVERIRGGRLTKIRERIAIRDEYTCQICKRVEVNGEVDHKVPLHLGGQETDENRWWLCPKCHTEKSEQEQGGRSHLQGS